MTQASSKEDSNPSERPSLGFLFGEVLMDDESDNLETYLKKLGMWNLKIWWSAQEGMSEDEKEGRRMAKDIEDKITEASKLTNGVSL